MFAYAVRRILIGLAMLVVMTLITFLLFMNNTTASVLASCGKNCQPEQKAIIAKTLGYDDPVYVQWGKFLKGVVAGRNFPDDPALVADHPELVAHCPAPCLGYSFKNSNFVWDVMKDAMWVSISIAVVAFAIWIIIGVLLGIIAALKRGTWIDKVIVGVTLVIFAFPTFFIGQLLYVFLAIKTGWFAIPSYTPIADGGVFTWLGGVILPAITLAVFYMAGYVRMTRAFVLETSTEDYIRTAQAKGLSARAVIGKHTFRAALTPIVTMAGMDLALVLGGAPITESVFNFNGLGKLAVTATREFDLPINIGIVVFLSAFVILANVVVDIAYAFIDPRVSVK